MTPRQLIAFFYWNKNNATPVEIIMDKHTFLYREPLVTSLYGSDLPSWIVIVFGADCRDS